MIVNFCTVPGCMNPHEANGLCGPCHARWRKKTGARGNTGTVAVIATVAASIARWWRENRKPGCHCWACRRLNKAEDGDQVLRLELGYHYHLWETQIRKANGEGGRA